ncbi:MAG TPA: type II secretion system protein [Luteolibacter sp.]|nr:type II secretion system protein [Luteolibacter sp.]
MIHSRNKRGFTLIELLVVVAIILTLTALVMVMSRSMLAKAKASTMARNMMQMSTLLVAYSTDNQEKMMPCRGDLIKGDGSVDSEALWMEIMLSMLYENVDPAKFKDDAWWKGNPNFLRNPLFTDKDDPRPWSALNPGYGYNLRVPENHQSNEGGTADPERLRVPVAAITEPARTPIFAPADQYYYRYDAGQIGEFESSATLKKFLSEGKFPVLFVDGHSEMVAPGEYINRRLHEMPMKQE